MRDSEKQILLNQLTILEHFSNERIGYWGRFEARIKETKELIKKADDE